MVSGTVCPVCEAEEVVAGALVHQCFEVGVWLLSSPPMLSQRQRLRLLKCARCGKYPW